MSRDELIVNNLRLIDYIIFKMKLQNNDNDYYGVGLQALIIASDNYDENKKIKFSTYAGICIKNEILKYVDSQKTNSKKANTNTISLNKAICYDDSGKELNMLDFIDSGFNLEKEIIEHEKITLLKNIIKILEPHDRFMLEHYFELWGNNKMPQKQIAKILNVKQSYVSHRIKRAMRIIKKIMEDKYGEEN